MLKIIQAPKNRAEIIYSTRINNNFQNRLCQYGIWMEYYEDLVINFKFFFFDGVIYVLKSDFFEGYTKNILESFFSSIKLDIDDLKEWINDSVIMEELEVLPNYSDKITNIWKYNGFKLEYRNPNNVPVLHTKLELFKKVKLQNEVVVNILPAHFEYVYKYWSPDLTKYEDKLYWFTLCHLKSLIALKLL